MPYIKERAEIDVSLTSILNEADGCSEGELNYIITSVVDAWLGGRPTYIAYNTVIGVLECAKLELYRRMMAPYEDKKCAENGDVYQQREFKPLPAIELPGKDEAK